MVVSYDGRAGTQLKPVLRVGARQQRVPGPDGFVPIQWR